jgi:hypothetical protein
MAAHTLRAANPFFAVQVEGHGSTLNPLLILWHLVAVGYEIPVRNLSKLPEFW